MSFFNILQPTALGRPPVWFLRQVGRYMPQYHELKGSQTLKDFFHDSNAITEATFLGPKLLQVDAAILFSDILSILDGFSISYDFAPGPQIDFSPREPLIFTQEPEEIFAYLLKSISTITSRLSVPLIAFAASPFTLASYLLDGGASKDFPKTMAFLYRYPEKFQEIITTIINSTAIYLEVQIKAGASAVQLFESSSLRLPSSLFNDYITEPNKALIAKLKSRNIPVSLFCRCFEENFAKLYATQADTLHPDYHVNLSEVYKTSPKGLSFQGNFDPAFFLLPIEKLLKYLEVFLNSTKAFPKYIFNSGHGILPETPLENIQAVVAYVQHRF